jgi:hypothetical protein
MTSPTDPEGAPPLSPVLNEYFGALAEQMGLEPQDPRIASLKEAVLADEELFVLIDGAERHPSQDP